MFNSGFTRQEGIVWFWDDRTGGGKNRWDMFARYDVTVFGYGLSIEEMGYVCKKPLVKTSDMKGLNMRGVGWNGLLFSEPLFQASGVALPGTDVYSALQTGVCDGCELGNIFSNMTQGLHEVCKYLHFPGLQQQCETSSMLINGKKFRELTPDVQKILQINITGQAPRSFGFNVPECAKAMERAEALGNIFVYHSPGYLQSMYDASWTMANRMASKDAPFKELMDKMQSEIKLIRPYLTAQDPNFGGKIDFEGFFKWSELKKAIPLR